MTREEIHEKIHFGDRLDYRSFNELHEVIEEIFDYFEDDNHCSRCKHHLSENGNFPLEPCGECSLWYSSQWESKE